MPNRRNALRSFVVTAGCLTDLLLSTVIFAAPLTQPIQQHSIEAASTLPPSTESQSNSAREWGLTPQEWARYQSLMQGPRGTYSPGLDPLTALGIEAQSTDERLHYAERQVRAERQRVEKELVYQRAYDQAFARLYPDEKIIELSSTPLSSPVAGQPSLGSDGRLAVFVREDCALCVSQIKALQKRKQTFDLYVVGAQGDDERIRRWAILAGIDPASVRSRNVTLNHDDGRWQGLGIGGDLPALVREVGGKWQRQ